MAVLATIVEDKVTHKKYFLLGAGLGVYKMGRPSFLGGNLVPHEESGELHVLAVCDNKGEVLFIESDQLRVVSIDDIPLDALKDKLEEKNVETLKNKYDFCPACGARVTIEADLCPNCGLRLQ